jgi:hypothetical protein
MLLTSAWALARRTVDHIYISAIDFTDSHSVTDRAQFYKNHDGTPLTAGGGDYPSVEVTNTLGSITTVPYVVYVRDAASGGVLVDITFYNPLLATVTGTWQCLDAEFDRTSCSPTQYDVLGASIDDDSLSIPSHGSVSKTLHLSGLPNVVCDGTFYIDLEADVVKSGSFTHIIAYGGYAGTLFEADASPTGQMATPWAEVLNDSCRFADGCHTTTEDCLDHCTKGLFHSGLFTYNSGGPFHIFYDNTDTANYGKFKLWDMMDFFARHGTYEQADWRDTSSYLLLLTSSLGHDGSLIQGYVTYDSADGMKTNDIEAIGTSTYAPTDWHFHQFFEYDGKVWDACAAQKYALSGRPNLYEEVPVHWDLTDYFQKPDASDFVGLVRGYWDQSVTPNIAIVPGDVSDISHFVLAAVGGPHDNVTLPRGVK